VEAPSQTLPVERDAGYGIFCDDKVHPVQEESVTYLLPVLSALGFVTVLTRMAQLIKEKWAPFCGSEMKSLDLNLGIYTRNLYPLLLEGKDEDQCTNHPAWRCA